MREFMRRLNAARDYIRRKDIELDGFDASSKDVAELARQMAEDFGNLFARD